MINCENTTITLKELFNGFIDNTNDDGSVIGYGGKLNIRPKYQREFVYNLNQQKAVITTILRNLNLGFVSFGDNGDGTYDLIDGQQRILSICSFMNGAFTINFMDVERDYSVIKESTDFDNYKLNVAVYSGTAAEKHEQFKVINTYGERLNDQELRNAAYPCDWLENAKQYFSKNNCVAYQKYKDYISGSPIRQDYLETVLYWYGKSYGECTSSSKDKTIEFVMCDNIQNTDRAKGLVRYVEDVFDWVKDVFKNYRSEMKGLPWGLLYNEYKDNAYNPDEVELHLSVLFIDPEVTNSKGIYEYVLSGRTKENCLSLRAFDRQQRRAALARQGGRCAFCGLPLEDSDAEAHHRVTWISGGKTTVDNCAMLHRGCHDTFVNGFEFPFFGN